MNQTDILHGIEPQRVIELQNEICKVLVGKGLSFRQAELLLDMAKERLKDAKI